MAQNNYYCTADSKRAVGCFFLRIKRIIGDFLGFSRGTRISGALVFIYFIVAENARRISKEIREIMTGQAF
jgi:hypothetical protein